MAVLKVDLVWGRLWVVVAADMVDLAATIRVSAVTVEVYMVTVAGSEETPAAFKILALGEIGSRSTTNSMRVPHLLPAGELMG